MPDVGMELTQREAIILESVIQDFIATVTPVSSRAIAKKLRINLSPATIRNIMLDLEDRELLCQPHTSAGRMPTDKGYRIYVDTIMKKERLSFPEKKKIEAKFKGVKQNVDLILTRASKVLGEISKQLGVVLTPRFYEGVVTKIQLVNISEKKILVVISIKSGIVRTIVMEVETDISASKLEETTRIINERLNGLSLKQIKESIDQRLKDVGEGDEGLLRQISSTADDLFNFDELLDYHYGGMQHIIAQPEFAAPERISETLELIENKRNIIIHLLNESVESAASILIGRENNEELLKDFSVITSPYRIGDATGIMAIIGPMRMQYARMIALVEFMGNSMSALLNRGILN
jgi:heat-inducible transcriptional repressor